ncbi:MAG TPA: DJ-1/PfpI family protein [Anaerolineales bacterium]|nr:DJ-1/PfpI family protein [Anaerolineales bacterium]
MKKTVVVYLGDGMADWEVGYAVAGLNSPQLFGQPEAPFALRYASIGGTSIRTLGGMAAQADLALGDVDPAACALLILPGGAGWDEGGHGEAIALAQRFIASGVPVAAICGATAGLARGGLLDTVAHTSNAAEYLEATGYRGAAHYRNDPAVTDGNVITANTTGSVAFAKHIFKRLALAKPALIDAWADLFTTGDPVHYGRLMALAGN